MSSHCNTSSESVGMTTPLSRGPHVGMLNGIPPLAISSKALLYFSERGGHYSSWEICLRMIRGWLLTGLVVTGWIMHTTVLPYIHAHRYMWQGTSLNLRSWQKIMPHKADFKTSPAIYEDFKLPLGKMSSSHQKRKIMHMVILFITPERENIMPGVKKVRKLWS